MSTYRVTDADMTQVLEKRISTFGFDLEFFSILNFHNKNQPQK